VPDIFIREISDDIFSRGMNEAHIKMDWNVGFVVGISPGSVVQKILQPIRAGRTRRHLHIHGNTGDALRERKQYTLCVGLYSDIDFNQHGYADFDCYHHPDANVHVGGRFLHRHGYVGPFGYPDRHFKRHTRGHGH
jgi:hypothetical protein